MPIADPRHRQSWQTLVPLVIGLVGLASWVSYEHTFPSQPMVPLSLFNNRTTSCALLGTFVIGVGIFHDRQLQVQLAE
jgi:hypothetical protein